MKQLEIYWDVGSPYSYLALVQLENSWKEIGDFVVSKPFLVGGVFKATGNVMPASVPAKALYMLQDLRRWREYLGVPLCLPTEGTPFPINTLLPMRCALAAQTLGKGREFYLALFRAYWGEGLDISQIDVLSEVVANLGLDVETFLEQSTSPENKERLRVNGEEAVERKVFGAPAFFVDGEHFWGNDRLDFALRAMKSK